LAKLSQQLSSGPKLKERGKEMGVRRGRPAFGFGDGGGGGGGGGQMCWRPGLPS